MWSSVWGSDQDERMRVCFLVVLFARVESLKCGKIWDGNTRNREISHTLSLNKLTANWAGFDDGNKTSILHYWYAIISQEQATPAILASGASAPIKTRCRMDSGIGSAMPDTVWFRAIPDGSSMIEKFKLTLTKGMTYYFILRVQQGNDAGADFLFTNTNGITAGKNGTFYVFHHDDDDDNFAGWKIGLITAGLAVFCLLLLLLLLIVVAKGKGEDKYTTTVHRNDNVEKF